MLNVVGPTLVAMATKLGLGAEIKSPTGLLLFVSVQPVYCSRTNPGKVGFIKGLLHKTFTGRTTFPLLNE